jgi:hypothetical protein
MIEEFALVALTIDLLAYQLKAGDMGTVVDVVKNGEAFVVEFATILGRTVAVVEVSPAHIRRVNADDIANVGQIAAVS